MLHFSPVPMLQIEAFTPCCNQKVYAGQTFCKGTVSNHSEEYVESNVEQFLTHELPSLLISPGCAAWLPKLLPPFLGNTQLACEVIFLFSQCLPVQTRSTYKE
jgi:hypothetical protein